MGRQDEIADRTGLRLKINVSAGGAIFPVYKTVTFDTSFNAHLLKGNFGTASTPKSIVDFIMGQGGVAGDAAHPLGLSVPTALTKGLFAFNTAGMTTPRNFPTDGASFKQLLQQFQTQFGQELGMGAITGTNPKT